jgi:LmbE family N-acetylglucosaminyl deacetylase
MNQIKMMKKVFLVCLLVTPFFVFAQQPKQKTILIVFPHPDDETAIAEVLIKYSRLGYKVQLIIATDGKDGTRVSKIPAGDSLGNLRKEETRCACKIMGIADPIFLGVDRLDTKIGVGKYFAEHKKFIALLKEKVLAINPDFIITFGPDGDTHHAEHIVTGAAVTELLLREGWVEKYPLYYVAWTKAQSESYMEELGYVSSEYFNVKVEYTQEEENKALKIMPCYPTQYTPDEIKEDHQKKINDKSNTVYFRRFVVKKGMQQGF